MTKNQTKNWQHAIEIYAEISELSVQDALITLDKKTNLSIELKQAVITLINSGNQASQYIEKNFTPDLQQFQDKLPEYKSGTILGEYELIEKLGQGGMSQVYKAKRIDSEPQKMVAIKIFSPHNNSSQLFNLFINEQKILSKFNHANIVDMLHGGKTDDTAYLVMELIENAKPINKYCLVNTLSTKNKIRYIAQCADALSYSHANLIIHRDLKPDNILINESKELKIVDFGIAKLINKKNGENTTIMALTPNYAAPEQINAETITVKTDIFSLAVVALDILCDENPLPKDRLIKCCINDDEYINKSLKLLDSNKDLKNILRKALAHNPVSRYSNMQSFSDDLNNWLDDKPVKATAPSFFYYLQNFARRRKALFSISLTLLSTITIGFFILSWQYHKTTIAEQKALVVKNFMLAVFSYGDPEGNHGKELSAYDVLLLAEDEAKYTNFSSIEIQAEILGDIGSAFVNMGNYNDGERNLLSSLLLDSTNIGFRIKLAQLYIDKQKLPKAQMQIKKISALLSLHRKTESSEYANFLLLQSEIESNKGVAIKLATQSQNTFVKLQNLSGILTSTRVLASHYFNLKPSLKPVEMSLEIIDSMYERVSPVNTQLLRLQIEIAQMYSQLGDYKKASPMIANVIKNIRNTLGNKHPAIVDALFLQSNIYQNRKMFDSALKAANECFGVTVKIFGKESKPIQKILSLLAKIEISTGDFKQAKEDLIQAHKLSIQNYGINHKSTIKTQRELAKLNSKIEGVLDNTGLKK